MKGRVERRGTVSQRSVEDTGKAPTSLGAATLAAIGRCVRTRPRRWLLAITLLLGLVAAVAVILTAQPAERTFTTLSGPVQILMSATLPFIGVLLARDVLRSQGAAPLASTLLAAILLAAAVGVFGVVVCAVSLTLTPPDAAAGRWDHAVIISVGSVLVQIAAQLVGTGLGLLLRPVVVACLATVVLPLGLWLVLGSVEVIRPAQAWLTPYAAARSLLSGHMNALAWAQWFVVILLWGAGLNALGAARLKR
jgi:hypothetical protein